MSITDKLLDKLNIHNKSITNFYRTPVNNPYDRSGHEDLFTTKASLQASKSSSNLELNSTSRSSIDSNRTIIPNKR